VDIDEFIATTMRRVADSAVPPARVAPSPAPPRRWFAPLLVAAAAAVVAAIVVAASMLGPHRPEAGPAAGATPGSSPSGGSACRVDYPQKLLPRWARAGFTPPSQPVPYVLGDKGDVAAIVWVAHHPLVAPPAVRKNNKILWVARVGAAEGPLQIRATQVGTGQTVARSVATGPGPSIIDLPAPGCWSFDLTWGSHHDHLLLGYANR
jgi:hypothetical protein